MKGFVVTYKGKTYSMSFKEGGVVTCIADKRYDEFSIIFGGMTKDLLHFDLIPRSVFEPGDEFVIEIKDVEKDSDYVSSRQHSCDVIDKEDMLKFQLERFLKLEKKLKEEGLI